MTLESHDMAQLQADLQWQLAKGHLLAVLAVHGARQRGGAFNEVESKYEVLGPIIKDFITQVEEKELHL